MTKHFTQLVSHDGCSWATKAFSETTGENTHSKPTY